MLRRRGLQTQLAAGLSVVLLLASRAAAASASDLHPVTDPGGHYTLSFPPSWNVVSMHATPLAGEIISDLPDASKLFSVMLAVDPQQSGSASAPAMLMVLGLPTDHALSPRTFGMMSSARLKEQSDRYVLVREGTATIARRPAFYRYFTMLQHDESLYMVMVYFTVGKTAYIVIGGAPNDPQTVRRSFAQISRILETFRPTGR
jgi:hypothetical protein